MAEIMGKGSKKPKSDSNGKASESPQKLGLTIEWFVPDDIETQSVSNMLLQADEHDVFLSFFDTAPPLVSSIEEVEELAKTGKKIRARCVARIAIAKTRFPAFAEAFSKAAVVPGNKDKPQSESEH